MARQLPAATTVDKSSDGHSCSWAIGRTSNGVAVTVNLESQRMTLASQQNLWHYGDNGKSFPGKAVTIDGRMSVVGPPDYLSSGAPSCAVQTNARAWPHGLGNDTAALKSVLFSPALYEVPEIYVTDNLPQTKLCAIATALATEAWKHLRA